MASSSRNRSLRIGRLPDEIEAIIKECPAPRMVLYNLVHASPALLYKKKEGSWRLWIIGNSMHKP
uniref:Uncharacterized protein n=1 Tax=Oryza punctata TaxID=4537 RepID=A0A0E0KZR5_ORYPU